MLGLGFMEIAVIAVVLMIFVPPTELPRMIRQLGRWYGQLRRAADEMRRAFVLEADRQDAAERDADRRARRAEAQAELKEQTEQAQRTGAVARPDGLPAPAPMHEQLGFSADEWQELPEAIRERLSGAAGRRADAAAGDPEAPAQGRT